MNARICFHRLCLSDLALRWTGLLRCLVVAAVFGGLATAVAAPVLAQDHPAGAVAEPGSHDLDAAHGEEDPPGLFSFDPGAAIWNLIIFLLVLFVLGMFVWPQILSGLQAREDKIHADLKGAETANLQANAVLLEYQRRLDEAQGQVQAMIAEAHRDAERVGSRIVEEAKADAERQRQRALADIEAAKRNAIAELANQTSDLAMSLARQVVGRELNPGDHAELIRQSLNRMPS